MRIIIFAFCFAFIGGLCHATEMCARNDTVVIPLDANSITNATHTAYSDESVWKVKFNNNYTIYGYSTCLSEAEGGKPDSGTMYKNSFGKTLGDDDLLMGKIGKDKNGNSRIYCWCQLIHPVKTLWVHMPIVMSTQQCPSSCAAQCSYGYSHRVQFLNTLYKSVGLK